MPHSLPTQREKAKTVAWLSRPRLSNLLVSVVIFFSATQLGLHFWPDSALIYGVRIDYLAPTLYFLDLVILTYLALTRPTQLRDCKYLLPIVLIMLVFARNTPAPLSWSLHALLYLSFVSTFSKTTLTLLPPILGTTLIFQVSLALAQVVLGHSVGGMLYYLGERMVAVGSPSVATATFMDNVVLRAYATFSHPNVLAGWLVVGCLIVFHTTRNKWYWIIALIPSVIGVILTQSRAAAFALFGLVIPFYLLKQRRARLLYFLLALVVAWQLALFSPTRADLSRTERQNLQVVSRQVIATTPFLGTGPQGSIAIYPQVAPNFRLLQPDHNSLTLLLSWFGFFGTLAILAALQKPTKKQLIALVPLLPLFLFDHYLLTSPQGLFILVLYLKTVSALN